MDRGERGQLVLVAALTLAAVLVALALLLNTTIYTANQATRSGVDSRGAVDFRGGFDLAAAGTIERLNAANTDNRSHGDLTTDLDGHVVDWETMTADDHAREGRAVSVARADTTPGWRVLQTNASRNFTAGGTDGRAADVTWPVAENVSETGVFEQNVSRTSLFGATYATTKAALADSAYHIAIDEPGTDGFWRVYVFEGVGTQQVYVVTETPDQSFQDSVGAHINWATDGCAHRTVEWVRMDVRAATLGGAPCDELAFFADLQPGYDVYYNNTAKDTLGGRIDRTQGTYELFVGDATVDKAPYYPASDGRSPFTLTALYAADYDVRYDEVDLTHTDRMRVEPVRHGGVWNEQPTVSISVDDQAGSYSVDWTASDPEGSLDEVELLLYENATGTAVDSESTTLSGASASGTDDLGPTSDGVRYDIYAIVTDAEGAATVLKRTDVAD